MLGFPLGILSAAGAEVGVAGAYELIETQVLGTAVSSITFSSLATYASTYKHLQIRTTARTTRNAGTTGPIGIGFNGDTTTSYAGHELLGGGASVSSFSDTSQSSIRFALLGANALTAANAFGAGVVDVLDPFSTTKNTTIRALSGGGSSVELASGLFFKTDSITSITLTAFGGFNLVAGSRFSIYGIKG